MRNTQQAIEARSTVLFQPASTNHRLQFQRNFRLFILRNKAKKALKYP